MIVLEARVMHARRNRDFGCVEAFVELIVKQSGYPARRVTVRTNQPTKGPLPLRQRLHNDAALLARHLDQARTVSAGAA